MSDALVSWYRRILRCFCLTGICVDGLSLKASPKTKFYTPPALPVLPHVVLPANSARTIIVGDVHGCLDELVELLELCGAAQEDRVVLAGDLVNKVRSAMGHAPCTG